MASDEFSKILASLQKLANPNDTAHVKFILSKMISLHSKGFNVSQALPKIVKLLANQDLVVKKALYNILTTYSFSDPDVILLATNTLLQECSDSNPMVRGLAIKTICAFNHETFLEYGIRCVSAGLKDTSAYVRRAAVCGCGQLNLRSAGICQEHGLVDQLYRLIRDDDPVVMVNAVVILEEILKNEGGIVINKNIAHYVLGKLESLTSWGASYILQILQKYHAKTEDEMFDILNILDPLLTHNNNSLSISCLELFLHFVKDFPHLRNEVIKQCFEKLVNVAKSGNSEVAFCVLELFEKYIEEAKNILVPHVKVFMCKHKESLYLKLKKINFMKFLITEENAADLLNELKLHATDSDKEISIAALKVIGFIHQSYPNEANECGTIFKDLLLSAKSHVVSNCLNVLKEVDLSKSENCGSLIELLCQSSNLVKDDSGKCALLMLLGKYGSFYSDAPYVVEEFIENNESMTSQVKVHLLHCCLRLFFYYPGMTQHLLGQVFEMCSEVNDECLRNMSFYYYSLLHTSIEDAKHIILNCEQLPTDLSLSENQKE